MRGSCLAIQLSRYSSGPSISRPSNNAISVGLYCVWVSFALGVRVCTYPYPIFYRSSWSLSPNNAQVKQTHRETQTDVYTRLIFSAKLMCEVKERCSWCAVLNFCIKLCISVTDCACLHSWHRQNIRTKQTTKTQNTDTINKIPCVSHRKSNWQVRFFVAKRGQELGNSGLESEWRICAWGEWVWVCVPLCTTDHSNWAEASFCRLLPHQQPVCCALRFVDWFGFRTSASTSRMLFLMLNTSSIRPVCTHLDKHSNAHTPSYVNCVSIGVIMSTCRSMRITVSICV